jgi:Leucine-rich repeat (LRR) protein
VLINGTSTNETANQIYEFFTQPAEEEINNILDTVTFTPNEFLYNPHPEEEIVVEDKTTPDDINNILDTWVKNNKSDVRYITASDRIKQAIINKAISLDLFQLYLSNLPPKVVFSQLTSLQKLNLSYNYIEKLNGALAGLTNLQYLDLAGNQINMLYNNDLTGLTSLQKLNLSHNYIKKLNGALAGLTNLQYLDLTGNKINSLYNNDLTGLTNLQTLDLSYNRINRLYNNDFTGLTSLQKLNLKDNKIAQLNNEDFSELTSLQTLNLYNNPIIIIEPNVFDGLEGINCSIKCSQREGLQLFIQTLKDILAKGGYSQYKFELDWNKLEGIDGFKQYISRIGEIADIRHKNSETEETHKARTQAYNELGQIIVAMDKDEEIRNLCVMYAEAGLDNCGDAINDVFLTMQIIKNNYNITDNKLSSLF